ncbi:chromate efflux transporter [Subsaximicrobium wynnwilliamsii]|uniref:Chromate efflux transporter n=1 Tax=Subsaximicrobium wynnwilliamsii TaxID=291179 RepID=A0A5C6ZK20_9FLAO|nr:chromate efflux transporter [Subsaximicrobium wynnwilliamsii]TXD84497.1 chromate efflux transporter [Subsaximicrobium wynnwilliamsii]TXD90179.1 chromate efflux transporter [Subsaximicrobium wynnwilliamsii]TXE04230.1 chromate efflux transporter [Subsaximicrobium wynnwilliamsii]
MSNKKELIEIAKLFFKLGSIAFGGPAAHIAMMEDEVVKKRKWMTQEHFLDLVGATNLIPGPNSTEMTMHCGHERAGWKGLFVAGFCFIFPAVVITSIFAWLYQQYGQLPKVEPFIYGIKPAVIAIIIMAAFRLGKKAVKNTELAILGVITLVACLFGVNEIIALFGCGLLGLIIYFFKKNTRSLKSFIPLLLFQVVDPSKIGTLKMFLTFLKVGAILYGSGYVLFAFLDTELVANGWLTRQALIDAVAVGQITPGPVLSTATFIGWQMNGITGAIVATLGIFLPSFLLVLILNPLIPKMRKSKIIGAILDAVNVAAVALIIAVCVEMAKDTLTDWRTILIAVASLIVVFVFKKVNSAFIVLGGAIIGYVLTFI